MLSVDSGKNLILPRNAPELSVDINLVICDLTLSKFIGDLTLSKKILLVHA